MAAPSLEGPPPPLTLTSTPSSTGALTQAIRNFAKSLESWLTHAMVNIPEEMLRAKVSALAIWTSAGLLCAWEDFPFKGLRLAPGILCCIYPGTHI